MLFLLWPAGRPFENVMRPKFQLDMGTLMLAFTMFWSYTSFSQFMLVWIGNLPEEIPFFLKRSAGGWWYVSAVLIALPLRPAVPAAACSATSNSTRCGCGSWRVYLLVICAVDVMWWIEPSAPHDSNFPDWVMDVGVDPGVRRGVWVGIHLAVEAAALAAGQPGVPVAGGAPP